MSLVKDRNGNLITIGDWVYDVISNKYGIVDGVPRNNGTLMTIRTENSSDLTRSKYVVKLPSDPIERTEMVMVLKLETT